MNEKVVLKKKYVKLIQEGKKKEAQAILKDIWNFNKNDSKEIKKNTPINVNKLPTENKIVKRKILKSKKRFSNIKDLSKIKGIGRETIKDLNRLYPSLNDLVKQIMSGKSLPIRNDIEAKLKKALI